MQDLYEDSTKIFTPSQYGNFYDSGMFRGADELSKQLYERYTNPPEPAQPKQDFNYKGYSVPVKTFPFNEWRDFDFLSENYPRYKDKIQEMRNQGIPDRIIERVFVEQIEPRLNYVGRKDQVNQFLGRTPESMQRVADYENAKRFDAYRQAFPDKSDDDIYNAIGISKWSGVAASTLLGNPELFKKLTEGQKVNESIWESIYRGSHNHIIQSQIGDVGLQYLRGVISKEEAYKREKELSSQYIENPLVQTGLQQFAEGGSKILTQGYYTLGEGALTGLATGGILAVAGFPLGASGQGFTAGYKLGALYASARRLFSLQAGADMLEFSKMVDENGQPIDENAARAAACITGAITVATELYTLPGIAKLIPGGDKLMSLAGLNRDGVKNLLITNPTFRSVLSKMVIDSAKGIGWGTINNVVETLGHDLGIPLAQAISGQPFPQNNIDYLGHVKEAITSSVRDFSSAAVPNLLLGIARMPRSLKQQREVYNNYRQILKDLSDQTGLSEAEIEQQTLEAINSLQEQPQENQEIQETQPAPAPEVTPEITQPEVNEQITQPQEIETPAIVPPAPDTVIESEQTPIIQETESPVTQEPESPAIPENENVSDIVQETQPEQINETPKQEITEQAKPDYIFIPRQQFETFKAEHPEFADVEGLNAGNETGLTPEQFERLRNQAPDFTNSILNDTRQGADGVTINEAAAKIENTDQTKAAIFHSEETQQLIKDTTQDYIDAGENQEEAETLANVRAVIDTVMKAREGVPLMPITIKEAAVTDTQNEQDLSRISPEYNINNPETWPDQERAQRFMELTNWKNLSESERNIKELLDILRNTKPDKADSLSDKSSEVIKGLRAEEPDNVRSEYNALLRAEYEEGKKTYQESAQDVKDSLSARTDLDPTRYENNSEFPAGKKRRPDMSYSFEELGVKSKIDIATDTTDLKVRIQNAGDKNPLIFSIKNYRTANLGQVLNDILSGTTLKNIQISDTPLAQYLQHALTSAWERLGLDMSEIESQTQTQTESELENITPANTNNDNQSGYFYTDPSGQHVSAVTFKYGKALVELLQTQSKGKNFAAHVHDIGHVTFKVMENLANSGSVQMKQDLETILKHADVTLEDFNADKENKRGGAREKAHEYFANAFMVYLSEGKAPTKKLGGVFERVRRFLLEVYDDITHQLNIEIDDEVREVFDRLLTLPGDESTSIADYALEDIQISHQIEKYQEIQRQAELDYAQQMADIQDLQENPENWEPPEESIREVENYGYEIDYRDIQADELKEQQEYIKSIVKIIKENGGLRAKDIIDGLGKELATEKVYKKWRSIWNGVKSGTGLEISKLAQILEYSGFQELADTNALLNWLLDTDNQILKEKIQPVSPHIAINGDTARAFLAVHGAEATIDYMKERQKFIKAQLKDSNINESEREAFNSEITEIQEWLKKIDPAMDDEIKPVKKTKNKISRSQMREAVMTGYKLGESKERALQKMNLEIYKSSWQERAQARFEQQLQQAREKDKKNYRERLERLQNQMDESKNAALARLEAKAKSKIKQINQRIQNLKEAQRAKSDKTKIARMVKNVVKMSKSSSILYDRMIEIQELLEGYNFDRSKKGRDRRDIIRKFLDNDGQIPDINDDVNFLNSESEQNTTNTQNENAITTEEIEAFLDKIHLEDMNIQDVKNLHYMVKNIYEQGKREFAIWKEKRDARRAGYAKSMSDVLEATTKQPKSRVIKSAQDLSKKFMLDRVGRLGVVFWNAIQTPGRFLASLGEPFRRLFEDEFTTRRGEAEQQIHLREKSMNQALQKLGLSISHFMNDAFTLDGETYTWSNVMAIYLGMKNEKSRKAILWGNFVKTLANPNNLYASEAEGMAAINKILEFINEHPDYKAAADLIIQDTDLHFDRINRARIEAFNRGMNKEENYTAMHRLKHQSSAGLIDDNTESLAQSGNAQALLQKVENNFTISRQEISEQNQQPIDLNVWKNWQTTVTNEEYMAALGGYAADLTSALLLRGENGSIQELIKSQLGTPYWNTLKSIFNDSITNRDILEQNGLSDIQSLATHFIKARSVAYVAFSPLSMLAQTSSYFLGLGNDYSSRSHLLRSLGDFVIMGQQGRGREFLERVYKLSPELRVTGGDPVERAIQNQWQNSNKAARFISQYGYKGVQVLDNWTKCIVFDAVYQSKLENGYSEEDAIRLANRAVHDTQPASTLREMPRILRGGGWTKLLLTQFMNSLAPILNMSIVDVARNLAHPSWNTVKATAWNMLAVGLTISWAAFLKDTFNGRLPTGNELANGEVDDWGKWLLDTNIENLINNIPVFNRLVSLWRMASGKQAYRADDRISEPFMSLVRSAKYAGEDNYRAFEEFIKGAALIGVPLPFSGIRQFMRFIGLDNDDEK